MGAGIVLSIDDHPVVHTPYLDTLALQGGRAFSRAYTAHADLYPGRGAALYTGTSQTTHGAGLGYLDGVAWDYPVTMAGGIYPAWLPGPRRLGRCTSYPERSQMGFQNVILHDGFINHPRSQHHNYELIDDYIPWAAGEIPFQYGLFRAWGALQFDCGRRSPGINQKICTQPISSTETSGAVCQAAWTPRKPFFSISFLSSPSSAL